MNPEILQVVSSFNVSEGPTQKEKEERLRSLCVSCSSEDKAEIVGLLRKQVAQHDEEYARQLENVRSQVGAVVSHYHSMGYEGGLTPSDEQFYDGCVHADNVVKNNAVERLEAAIRIVQQS